MSLAVRGEADVMATLTAFPQVTWAEAEGFEPPDPRGSPVFK